MASKAILLFVLTCFLVINTKVSSEWDKSVLIEVPAPAPTPAQGPICEESPPISPPETAPTPSPVAQAPPIPPPLLPPGTAPIPSPVVQAPPIPPPLLPPGTAPTPSPVAQAPAPSVRPPRRPRNILECIPACVVRCRNHPRILTCMSSCLTCCDRCKCVPSGQYGNREQCGTCYTDMRTRDGRPRCP